MFKLQHKTVLITYATNKIGQAVAERFGSLGAKVVLHHSDDNDLLVDNLVKNIKSMGATVHSMASDITTEDQLERFLKEARSELKKIDIVVFNPKSEETHFNYLKLTAGFIEDNGRVIYIIKQFDGQNFRAIVYNIKELADIVSSSGITVNAVITQNTLFKKTTESMHIADATEFFASDLSDMVSGQYLIINGLID